MPDAIENLRTATERELSEMIGKLGPTHRKRIRDAVEAYGSVRAIPPEVWESMKRDVDQQAAAILLVLMMGVYGAEYRRTTKQLSTDQRSRVAAIDDETLQRAASAPASVAGRQVADEYVNRIKTRLETHVDDKAEEINQLPPREAARMVKAEIDDAIGEEAAETTVVTNTTKVVTASQNSAGDDIGRMAQVQMTAVWKTERDAKVCPICRPLDGKTIDQWEAVLDANVVSADSRAAIISQLGPPAHPNCRCRVEHVVMDRGDN